MKPTTVTANAVTPATRNPFALATRVGSRKESDTKTETGGAVDSGSIVRTVLRASAFFKARSAVLIASLLAVAYANYKK